MAACRSEAVADTQAAGSTPRRRGGLWEGDVMVMVASMADSAGPGSGFSGPHGGQQVGSRLLLDVAGSALGPVSGSVTLRLAHGCPGAIAFEVPEVLSLELARSSLAAAPV